MSSVAEKKTKPPFKAKVNYMVVLQAHGVQTTNVFVPKKVAPSLAALGFTCRKGELARQIWGSDEEKLCDPKLKSCEHTEHKNSEEKMEDYELECDCPVYDPSTQKYKTRGPLTDGELTALAEYQVAQKYREKGVAWDASWGEEPTKAPTFYDCESRPCFSQDCNTYSNISAQESCWKVGIKLPNLVKLKKGAVKLDNTIAHDWSLQKFIANDNNLYNKMMFQKELLLSDVLRVIDERVYGWYEQIAKKAGIAPVPKKTFTWAININTCRGARPGGGGGEGAGGGGGGGEGAGGGARSLGGGGGRGRKSIRRRRRSRRRRTRHKRRGGKRTRRRRRTRRRSRRSSRRHRR